MIIKQYIENISNRFKNGIKTPANADVECVDISKEFINEISRKLKLAFINEEEKGTAGEVCFANSPEVRPEFRLTFTAKDIVDYVYAVMKSRDHRGELREYLKNFQEIPIPEDTDIFWTLVAIGKELIKIHSVEDSNESLRF